ncbi:PREDICTED: E3 ubiquitin-protein ligase ATL41 [Camelina sativa]|uniref:RING-type E3 ubiquitin transferase n=1 Tax=Camelina sativa TaxID=90675 RepID=A0ABM0ZMA6_CAMSA|nr:PREDICTED: E3 ubiquitin-protein ligase ATL41 [Camelina sativa]
MSSNERDTRWFNSDHHSFWPNPSNYDLNSKIMLAAIASLSGVILIVFALHLYARFVLRRRREAFRGLPVIFRHPFEIPKRGLNPTVIASLPTFTVGAVNGVATSATECAVCLSLLEEQDTARELPNCKHIFHVDCVDRWLWTCSTCPVCRTEVEPRPRLEPEPREGPVSTAPPLLEEARLNLTVEAAPSSSSGNKTVVSPVSRLDSFKRILTRERSSNRINHTCVDQDRVADLERH